MVAVARALCCTRGRDNNRTALFLAGLWAGIMTGAATGAVVGASVVGVLSLVGSGPTGATSDAILMPFGAGYGLFAGTWFAVVPSVIGAAAVTAAVSRREPLPAAQEAVEHMLVRIFRAVVVLLDAAVVTFVVATGTPAAGVLVAVPVVAVANACVIGMLCLNRAPMARAWVTVRH